MSATATAAAKRKRKRRKPKPGCTPVKAKKRKKKSRGEAERARRREEAQPPPVAQALQAKKKKRKPQPSGTHPAPAAARRAGARARAGARRPAPPAPGGPAPRPRSPSTRARSARARPSGCCGAPASARGPGDAERLAAMGLDAAVFSLTRPSGAAPMDGPGADRRRRAAVAAGHLVRRPPVLVRPHGPLGPPARRAARAGLPRLVGDDQRRGRLQRADARPDQRLPRRTASARSAR